RECAGVSSHLFQRVEELIDARLEQGLDIPELAMSLGCSESHFYRMFRKSFGITPHRYLIRRRLSLAQTLLTQSDARLSEIALRAGFSDQSHFCRCFHQFTGISPRAFRLQRRLAAMPAPRFAN